MEDEWGTSSYTDYQIEIILKTHLQRLERLDDDISPQHRETLNARIMELKKEQARRQSYDRMIQGEPTAGPVRHRRRLLWNSWFK